jgi:RNA polymerase sigma factor (sigma-70 family)
MGMTVVIAFDPAETARIRDDPAALERFYRAHFDEVVRYLARRVSDPHDVADLVAESFLGAIDSAASFDPARGRPVAWLIGIAQNKMRRYHRHRGNDHDAAQRLLGRRLLDGDDIADLEARIDAEADGATALGALHRLSPGLRELIDLVDLQGLTPAEAANVCGISAGLARIRLHRARRALRIEFLARRSSQ